MNLSLLARRGAFLLACSASALAATYYVAPGGSNSNSGLTVAQAWATARHAAQTIVAGDTVIFENGIYNETQSTVFANSGTSAAPIVFKARNRHGAKLNYAAGLANGAKVAIPEGKEYITVQDFEITQVARGTQTTDILLQAQGHHATLRGNKIHFAYEDGIKVSGNENTTQGGSGHVVVEGNVIYDIEHEGIDAVRMWSSSVRYNEIYQVKRLGIMLKGGIRSVLVHGNYVHSPGDTAAQAINIGGSTDAEWAYDSHGWEAYNSYGWSNIVQGPWSAGLSLRGAKDSGFFNNTVTGASRAIITELGGKGSGTLGTNMWYWTASGPFWGTPPGTVTGTPSNQNVFFKNNIIHAGGNANAYATNFRNGSLLGGTSTLTLDYNLYYGFDSAHMAWPGHLAKPAEQTSGSTTLDPLFVTNYTNLRLQPASPAIDSAVTISGLADYFGGPAFNSFPDFAGKPRAGIWEKGAYAFSVSLPFTDDFEDNNPSPWIAVSGTWAIATDGTKVYSQTSTTGDAVSTVGVGDGWTDQSVQARVKIVTVNGSNRHASVYARYTDFNNHYYLALRTNNTVELKKKVGGVVTLLKVIPFSVTTGTWYTLRLDVVGTSLVGSVNGAALVAEIDTQLAGGGAALGMFDLAAEFDDISVKPSTVKLFEDFEDSVANNFTTTGGTWSVATDGTKVYRQSSTTVADAWAVHGSAWSDQIVAVDVKPISFNGTNRHVSVYGRWTDTNNHYYVAMRNSGIVELKKKVGGVVTLLDSASFAVTTGTWYAVRLEIIGTSLKASIDGVLVVDAFDSALTSGKVALGSFAASASFGDVVVTGP